MTRPTPHLGSWWIVRLEGGALAHLAQVVELTEHIVTLHLSGWDHEGQHRPYPVAAVEWVRKAPQYVTPVALQDQP